MRQLWNMFPGILAPGLRLLVSLVRRGTAQKSRPLATLLALGLLVSAGLGSTPEALIQAPAATNRMSVAILSFSNQTGNPDLSYWRFAAEGLLAHALNEVKGIHFAAGAEYARHQIKPGESLDAVRARKLGELIEARRVIWGTYERRGKEWLVTARVLNVASGREMKPITARSGDWRQIGILLATGVLKRLGITPTRDERRGMQKSWTDSPEALEWLCKATDMEDLQKPLVQAEAALRQAIKADPGFSEAYVQLAGRLFSEGNYEEAERVARLAVNLTPKSEGAHYALGAVLGGEQKLAEAEKSLLAAAQLDAEDGYVLERLGELYDLEGFGFKATQAYEHGKEADPFSASIRAHLGCRYAEEGRIEEARRELSEAERLGPSPYLNVEQFLAYGYDRLRDAPSALLHYEKLVSGAKELGANSKLAKGFEQRAIELKARLLPVFVDARKPKRYSQKELDSFLRENLVPGDLLLLTNPVESTSAMDRWAHSLVVNATNDLQKAQLLFDAIAQHMDRRLGGLRTAQQVFAAWSDTNASFRCSEYAVFYVALSRACGLDSYCVYVEEDCRGKKVCHECACVFVGEKALLVDPAYSWFGPPHRKFATLDDVEAIALWLSQQRHKRQEEMACRLAPDLAEVRFIHVFNLLNRGETKEAKSELAEARKLKPDGPLALAAEGQLALRQGDLKTATQLLEKAAAILPLTGTYLPLGVAYSRQEKFTEAREAFRNALRAVDIDEDSAKYAREGIAVINEALGDSSAGPSQPKSASDFTRRGDVAFWRREFDKAIGDYTEAVRLEPDNPANYFRRAWVHYEAKQFSQEGADLRETLRLEPANTNALVMLVLLLSDCPDKSLRNAKEAVDVTRKACEVTEWKQWRLGCRSGSRLRPSWRLRRSGGL